jgi:hypothetical protein
MTYSRTPYPSCNSPHRNSLDASENKWRALKNDCIKMQEAVYLFQS